MKIVLCALICSTLAASAAAAATVQRSYSYFSVHGSTLEEIQKQLDAHGPHVASTGQRHAGATRMEFTTRLTYAQGGGQCRISKASVTVKARVILPRWRDRKKADQAVRLIWDTLERDIKRHEESHLVIAKRHARELEDTLTGLYPMANCEALAKTAHAASARILAEHDADQASFDRIENRNFEARILSLLQYRLQQMSAASAHR